jgi:hypothetical protein
MLLAYLKWSATAVTLAGAAATALALDPLNIYLLNLGSMAWLVAAVMMKDRPLIAINAGLLAIYGLGFLVRMA